MGFIFVVTLIISVSLIFKNLSSMAINGNICGNVLGGTMEIITRMISGN
jgi:hypothetical protein